MLAELGAESGAVVSVASGNAASVDDASLFVDGGDADAVLAGFAG